jgi:thiol-disulfide isomerase/thioredoxin
MRNIIFFHGEDCPHCARMRPIVDKLEKQLKCKITRLEVWYNEKNAEKMRGYADIIMENGEGTLGVPAFVDVENKECLVGEQSEKELKKWLKEK